MAQKKAPSRSKSEPARRKSSRRGEESEQYKKAVDTFERALKSLHKAESDRARTLFEQVLSDFPEEKELGERARIYLAICDRKSARPSPSAPRDFDEAVMYGVFNHNQGDYEKAAKYLGRAVELQPKNDYAHYCLAAAYARLGDAKAAARHLKEAVDANAYNRVLAKNDSDFEPLRQAGEVAELLA